MDLVRTLDETSTVAYDSSSDSDSEDLKANTTSKVSDDTNLFNRDFNFELGNSEEYVVNDTWTKEVEKLVKKRHRNRTTVQQKIDKVRAQMEEQDDDEDDDEEEDDDNDEGDDDDDDDQLDAVRLKDGEVRRKERRKRKLDDKSDSVKVILDGKEKNEVDDEDNNDDFFESYTNTADESKSFYDMNLSRPLLKALQSLGMQEPTPIQSAAIPLAMAGRDVCGSAATGTGKTAAYLLPVLERLLFRPGGIKQRQLWVTRVLVLVPTRELGVQVFQVAKQLSQFANGIEIGLSVGGLDLKSQEHSLRKSPDIVIATPGRLIDHIKNTPSFHLENIEVLVLDEADRMLDECFLDQMKAIVKSCSRTRQTLLFSATMTDQVQDLAAVSLSKPVKIFVDSNRVVAFNLRQEFVRIRAQNEAKPYYKEALLAALLTRSFRDHTMVFVRTKQSCHHLHILLGLLGVRSAELHGNMTQASRLQALKHFKDESVDVLIATDVAARGLDIVGVKTVVNFELPHTLEHYIHRVGRTARAGRVGRSVSLSLESDRKLVKSIVREARDAVRNRVVPPLILDKLIKRIGNLQPQLKLVLEEEKAEREIDRLQLKTKRMEEELKGEKTGNNKKRLFLEKDDKKKGNNKKMEKDDKKKGRKSKVRRLSALERKKEALTDEERAAQRTADTLFRQSKREQRPKKMRAMVEDDEKERRRGSRGGKKEQERKKKSAKKSAFDVDLTNTSRTNLKRLRHEANAKRREGGRKGGKMANKQGNKMGNKKKINKRG